MTVVDQTSRVPILDAASISRLASVLGHPDVVAGFLIGSQARGSAGPLSDVDVAILHVDGIAARERLELRLRLAADAGAALKTSEVDIVLLNGAPPLLRHRALRDGVVLVDRDPVRRIRFQVETMRDYIDTEPLREALAQRLSKKLREGTYGRRA